MRFIKKYQLPPLPVYPFLFGVFPVLYLWSANRTQQPAHVIIPALAVTLAVLALISLAAFALLRNIHRAALATAVFSLFVFSYGHFYTSSQEWAPGLQHGTLLLAATLLVLGVQAWFAHRRFGSPQLTHALNLVGAGLVIFQLIPAVTYYVAVARVERIAARVDARDNRLIPSTGSGEPPNDPPRDVYFILLDNYGRQDVLLDEEQFDNSALVQALQERGFVFPDCAQANYFHTAPMITSILNMEYLDTLGIKESSYATRRRNADMAPLIKDNAVIRKFRSYGYHVVTFRGFMSLIDIQSVDTYVSIEKDVLFIRRLETANFLNLYFQTTAFAPLFDQLDLSRDFLNMSKPESLAEKAGVPAETDVDPRFYQVYRQNLYAFDALEHIPREIMSPKFVYAHLYSAHWPFVHRPDGSLRLPITEKITRDGYIDGIRYTNSRILDAIDAILSNSTPEPIIILQGDHANGWVGKVEWSGTDRVKILSAYYLPAGGDRLLTDQITPVNNFRLVFNYYFGEPLDLLPDISHYLEPQTRKVRVAPLTCMSDADR